MAKPRGGKMAAAGGAVAGGGEAKAAKDKGPKRAISAFFFFCTAKRGELKCEGWNGCVKGQVVSVC